MSTKDSKDNEEHQLAPHKLFEYSTLQLHISTFTATHGLSLWSKSHFSTKANNEPVPKRPK
jgi:hypothetical protein